MSKRLGEIIGCKDKTSWYLNEFPDGGNWVNSIMSRRSPPYTYINRHAGTPKDLEQTHCSTYTTTKNNMYIVR